MLHYNKTRNAFYYFTRYFTYAPLQPASFSIKTRHFTHAPLQPDTSLILHYNKTLHSCSITTRHFTIAPLQPDT